MQTQGDFKRDSMTLCCTRYTTKARIIVEATTSCATPAKQLLSTNGEDAVGCKRSGIYSSPLRQTPLSNPCRKVVALAKPVNIIWRALKLSSRSIDSVNYPIHINGDHRRSAHHEAGMYQEGLDRCKERAARTDPRTPRLRCRCHTSTCNPANSNSAHNHMTTK